MSGPPAGERAPDFTLSGTTGEVRLADLLATGPVVLLFYMEDSTPTCSQQVASFRDEHATLAELGAQVVAISTDPLGSHQQFADRLGGLPFPLLSDPDLRVARLYGVADEPSKRARRAVFVIGTDGTVLRRVVPYSPGNVEQFLGLFEALGLE